MSAPSILELLPERLRNDVVRAAAADETTPEAWVERAVARQLDDARWRDLFAYGRERAEATDRAEDDVERLIAEVRAERRAEAAAASRTGSEGTAADGERP